MAALTSRRRLPRLGKASPIRPRYLPTLLVLPAFVVLLAITIFPLLFTATLTVLSWELTTNAPARFVALGNFATVLFEDSRFWNAMRNTAVLVVVGVGLQVILGTGLALLVNRVRRGRTRLPLPRCFPTTSLRSRRTAAPRPRQLAVAPTIC